jgi:hypothetical protein
MQGVPLAQAHISPHPLATLQAFISQVGTQASGTDASGRNVDASPASTSASLLVPHAVPETMASATVQSRRDMSSSEPCWRADADKAVPLVIPRRVGRLSRRAHCTSCP